MSELTRETKRLLDGLNSETKRLLDEIVAEVGNDNVTVPRAVLVLADMALEALTGKMDLVFEVYLAAKACKLNPIGGRDDAHDRLIAAIAAVDAAERHCRCRLCAAKRASEAGQKEDAHVPA